MTTRERDVADAGSISTRRKLLLGGGALAGIAGISGCGGQQSGDGTTTTASPDTTTEDQDTETDSQDTETDSQDTEDEPSSVSDEIDASSMPYARLDPEAARELGRQGYYEGMHCGEGSLNAVLTLLREEVGGPWNDVPSSAALWSKGGGVGWSAVCGAVVGSNMAISLVHGRENEDAVDKLVDEFQRWYTREPFPTWTPSSGSDGITDELPQAESGSILCHASVTNWCKESGYASGSAERSERCSRVTGESAARAVELLNAEHEDNLDSISFTDAPSSVDNTGSGCRTCHFKGDSADSGQYTRGKMDCLICHDGDPHSPESLG